MYHQIPSVSPMPASFTGPLSSQSETDRAVWQTFLDGLNGFTSDIFEDGRDQGAQENRESWTE